MPRDLGPRNVYHLTYLYNGMELPFHIRNTKRDVTLFYESPPGTKYSHYCAENFAKLWVNDDRNENYRRFIYRQVVDGKRHVAYVYRHTPTDKSVAFVFRRLAAP